MIYHVVHGINASGKSFRRAFLSAAKAEQHATRIRANKGTVERIEEEDSEKLEPVPTFATPPAPEPSMPTALRGSRWLFASMAAGLPILGGRR